MLNWLYWHLEELLVALGNDEVKVSQTNSCTPMILVKAFKKKV